jgi:hypothetical protein
LETFGRVTMPEHCGGELSVGILEQLRLAETGRKCGRDGETWAPGTLDRFGELECMDGGCMCMGGARTVKRPLVLKNLLLPSPVIIQFIGRFVGGRERRFVFSRTRAVPPEVDFNVAS